MKNARRHLKQTLIVLGLLSLCCVHQRYDAVDYKLSEDHKEALLYHDGEAAHLILRTRLSSQHTSGPAELAWVIPLPSLPISYDEAPENLFPELYALLPDQVLTGSYSIPFTCSASEPTNTTMRSPIHVHAVQQVGSYQIQAVEIKAADAGAALNQWLRHNGFGEVSPEQQAHYLAAGRCFLCIKVDDLDRSGDSMQLKGLHIRYPGNELVLPLKFSTHSGTFAVDLYYIATAEARAENLGELVELGFEPKGQGPLVGDIPPSLRSLKDFGKQAVLHRFVAQQVNSAQQPLSNWPNDPTIRVTLAGENG